MLRCTTELGYAMLELRQRGVSPPVAGVALLSVMARLGRAAAPYAALIPALTLIILLVMRGQFTMRREPHTARRGVGLLVVRAVIAILYGTAGFWPLARRDFGLTYDAWEALARALRELLLAGHFGFFPHARQARRFLGSSRALGPAPLSGVGDEADASLQEHAIHQLVEHLDRLFSVKGLRSDTEKFEPQWVHSVMMYQGGVPGLVRAGLACERVSEE